ncbi:hypothetical protein HY029_00580 [Candidatus Gottesmanbacteria bacterium]|nr:hypothetical protein [Candidatus Gottesmanbacteria bacterium]
MKTKFDYLSYLHQYEILIASSGVLMIVIVLTFNMLLPNLNHANQIYAQGQDLKKKVELLTQKDSSLTSLNYQFYKDVFLKSSQILPENKDYVSLIGTFDLLEKQSGITIVRTDFQLGVVSTSSATLQRAAGTAAFMIPISVEVMGNLEGLRKFLDLVSNYNGRLMTFDEVTVNNKQSDTLDVVLSGRAFFYILPGTLGSIDSPLPKLEKSQDAILQKINLLSLPQDTVTVDLDKNSIGKKNLFQ